MISASHNPFEDNGIKFFDAQGNKLSEEIEAQIEAIAQDTARLEEGQVTGRQIGAAKRIDDVIGRYIVQLKNSFSRELTLQGLRIVLDTANGAAYKVGPTVLEELGAEVIVLHDKPNGININEGCGAMHTKDLREAVKQYRADIGLALDGDADRLIVVDEKGDEVDGDQILGALGLFLNKNGQLKGGGIVATVMSNQALEDAMNSAGLKLFRSNVGDKYVLEVMREKGINFGGEQSGHIILHDYAKTGDGLMSALQILSLLLTTGQKASKVLRPFKLYPQKLVNIKVKIKKPLDQIEGLSEELIKIEGEHMRHLIRYSGTENKLRLLLEGKDAKVMEKAMEHLVRFFEKALNG
jgi:phosphoglucosamine mutase